eukprot:c10877_g1_i2.p1 GENE.c10877_g1_i2~~c10877_g1_i2.p1  ORF type:complete len:435 (+),score=97.09 c10877_g1_i2:61-1365(+)
MSVPGDNNSSLPPNADDDKEAALSPNAPVFFPKWKRNSPTSARKPFASSVEGGHDDGPHPSFPSDFGRSLSGGFYLGAMNQLHPAGPLNPTSPIGPSRPGLGRAVGTGVGFNAQTTATSPSRPGIGPGMLGPRSASWREDATQSWRGDTSAVTSVNAAHQQLMNAGASAEDGKGSSKAITVEHRLIKPGTYSTWIRVLSADIGPAQLASVLSRCEESNNKGVIHVYLREKFINRQLVQQLKSQLYKFHHYVDDTQTFVYVKRPLDAEDGKEVQNATAKEMVGALVVSPDDQQVLLLWEGGKWTFVSGFALTRESVIDAVRRELRTQLSIEVDKAYNSRVVGGWSRPSAKAVSTTLTTDDDIHARWFNIDELMQLLDMVDNQFKQMGVEPKLDSAIEHPPGNVFSQMVLRWVKTLRSGASWPTTNVAERHVFCCT